MGFVSAIVTAVAEGANLVSDVASGGPQKRARASKAQEEADRILAEAKRIQEESRISMEAARLQAQRAQDNRESLFQSQKTTDTKAKQRTQMFIVGGIAVVGVLGLVYWAYD